MKKRDIKRNAKDAVVTEAYKTARINIEFSIPEKKCKCVLLTSPGIMEGKTTTSINLAAAFAKQVDKKAVVIDCDLHKPRIKKYLNIKNRIGLSEYLCKPVPLESILCETDVEGLTAICCGEIPPNPSELLASDKMTDLIEKLRERYDYIVIDTPPINLLSDTLLLTKHCDGVVAVVRARKTQYRDVDKMLEKLNVSGAKMLGFILNRDVNGSKKRKHGSKDYYGYYYG